MDRQQSDSFPADAGCAPSAPPPGCPMHTHAAAAAFRHSAKSAPIPSRPASGGAHETGPTPNPLKLTAYPITDASEFTLVPAPGRREWMDATGGRFAYRCLPLSMANQAGWWITCPCDFKAHWNGGVTPSDTRVTFADGKARDCVASHFGTGILTFGLPWLFQTSEGWGLWARGPANHIKDNCIALDGIIETDWAPYTFTMNWRIMRRGVDVFFRKGEPICQLVPFWLSAFEGMQPQFRPSCPKTRDSSRSTSRSATTSARSSANAPSPDNPCSAWTTPRVWSRAPPKRRMSTAPDSASAPLQVITIWPPSIGDTRDRTVSSFVKPQGQPALRCTCNSLPILPVSSA